MATSDCAAQARARRSPRSFLACCLLAALGALPAFGQEFPGRPIRFMISMVFATPLESVPRAILDKLNRGIVEALRAPDLAERFLKDGVELVGSTPADFQRHIHAEIRKWERVVAAAGIKPE